MRGAGAREAASLSLDGYALDSALSSIRRMQRADAARKLVGKLAPARFDQSLRATCAASVQHGTAASGSSMKNG